MRFTLFVCVYSAYSSYRWTFGKRVVFFRNKCFEVIVDDTKF